MRIRRELDGSIEIRESRWVLRVAMLVGGVAVPWAVVTSGTEDRIRLILGVVAGLFMLALAFVAESRRFRFDSSTRMMHWHRSRLFGSRSGTLPFSAISSVIAQPRMDDDNPRTRRLSYHPVLLTAEGEMSLSTTASWDPADYEELFSQLRALIGIAEPGGENAISDLVRAGRTVDAITLARRQLGLSLEGAEEHVRQIQRSRRVDRGGAD